MAKDPVFFAFALTVVLNWLLMTFLWNFSGAARGKTKTTLNPEDARAFKSTQVEHDPESVARVMRVHRNVADNTLPFLFLAAVLVMLRPSPLEAQILFYGYTGARVLYAICYLGGIQPWRTVMYALSVLLALGTAVDVLRLLFTGA